MDGMKLYTTYLLLFLSLIGLVLFIVGVIIKNMIVWIGLSLFILPLFIAAIMWFVLISIEIEYAPVYTGMS